MQPISKLIPGFFDDVGFSSPDGDDDSSASPNAGSPAWDDPGTSGSSPSEIDDSRRHGLPIRLPIPIPVRPSPVTLPPEPASPTGFTINITWDSSVASAPSGFTSDILAAVNFLETQFADPVTININVGYQEVAGGSLGNGDLGESLTNLDSVSYASLLNAVTADATSAADAGVVASLPATSPVSNGSYWVSTAQAKALGLAAASDSANDGSVGFGAASLFTFGDTNNSGTVAPGTYDFFATAVHEMTEVMGRLLLVGESVGGAANSYSLLDLMHYSAPGTPDLKQSTPGYFSVDGGTTDLGDFNTITGGDAGDWATSVSDDSFDAFASSGVIEAVTPNDLTAMDAIGWQPAGSAASTPPATPPAPPAGVSITPETRYLAHAQGRSGLSAGTPLATVAETGGIAGDKFSYALTGTGAASFGLNPASKGAVLTTGAHGVTGSSGGTLYALTITATDETATGNPSVADPINVVAGDNGNDVIDLSSLPGIVTAAPTFIYGLGGIDTIDGAGMTGMLYFDGGTGADTMTGGGGANVYEYGGAVDSTGSAMDIITNFNVAVDLIDLTGISSPFGTVQALDPTATKIAAGWIGWQRTGGNTFVYANTSNRTETLASANMKIELQGTIALASANFTHS
jgi:hypothetical protein